jgi:hypothetical protein
MEVVSVVLLLTKEDSTGALENILCMMNPTLHMMGKIVSVLYSFSRNHLLISLCNYLLPMQNALGP